MKSIMYMFIVSLMFVVLSLSGCISTPTDNQGHMPSQKMITEINLYNNHLNYSEIVAINKTNLSQSLEKIGYTIEDYNPYFNFSFYAAQRNSTFNSVILYIRLDAYTQNDSKITKFSFFYYPSATASDLPGRYNETLAKQYVTEKSNEFAQIANITMPWEFAEWSITYAD